MKNFSLLFIPLFYAFCAFAQPEATVSLTTVSYGGEFAPKSCFAMWVTDTAGHYIRTINYQGNNYAMYLTHCNTAAADSDSAQLDDGVSGVSLNVHNWEYAAPSTTMKRIPFVWDCTDQEGNLVPNGTYFVNVEFTEDNDTGKFMQFAFEKGDDDVTYTRENVDTDPGKWFTDVSVAFKSGSGAVGIDSNQQAFDFIVYNEGNSKITVSEEGTGKQIDEIKAYDITGRPIATANEKSIIIPAYRGILLLEISCSDNSKAWRKIRF